MKGNQDTSAVVRIPREILTEIFRLAAPTQDAQALESNIHRKEYLMFIFIATLNTMRPPWTLGQVCHYWRDVALSDKHLWSPVAVAVTESNIPGQHAAWLLEEWLRRSGARPLDVFFYAPPVEEKNLLRDQGISVLLQILTHSSSRWRSVCLVIPKYMACDLSSVRASLPILERLRLGLLVCQPGDSTGSEGSVSRRALDDSFQDAPKLLHVEFSGSHRSYMHLQLPWTQLKSYSAGSTHTIHEILGQCPRLETYNVVNGYRMRSNRTTLRHLHLRELSMYWTPGALEFLELPALENLSILYVPNDAFPVLTSFFQRSNCSITQLALIEMSVQGVDKDEVMEFFKSIPTLQTFAMTMLLVTNQNVEAILWALSIQKTATTSQITLPNLGILSLRYSRYEPGDIPDDQRDRYPDLGPVDLHPTIAMLQSRLYISAEHSWAIKPLQVAAIAATFPITGEERSLIRELQADGLLIVTERLPRFRPKA